MILRVISEVKLCEFNVEKFGALHYNGEVIAPSPAQTELIFEVFLRRASESPNRIFLRQPDRGSVRDFSWALAADQAKRMASAIKSLDLPPQSKIAILSKNCAHWLLADLAIWMSGHVSVPLYPNLSAETVRTIIEHSETKMIFLGKLDQSQAMLAGIPASMPRISFPYQSFTGALSWENLIRTHAPIDQPIARSADDLATIIYTSGTTGRPKGVMHSFGTIAFAGATMAAHLGINQNDVMFSYLPLAHVAERLFVETFALYAGPSIYFAESLETFARDIQLAQPTAFLGVPRIWTKFQQGVLSKFSQKKLDRLLSVPILSYFVKRKIKRALGFSRLKLPITGAAPIPTALLEWYRRLGITIQEAYAMSENFGYSHCSLRGKEEFGCVGQALPEVEVRFSNAGEIQVRSPATMMGYFKEPELSRQTLDDRFVKTGDLGSNNEAGYLAITGRVKDLFKTSKGKYVAPGPIEMQLASSEFIEQVCVLGSGLPQPVAIATFTDHARGSCKNMMRDTLDDHLKQINARLDPHERLSKLVIVDESWSVENELLTPTMKIKRQRIEKKYESSLLAWGQQKSSVLVG